MYYQGSDVLHMFYRGTILNSENRESFNNYFGRKSICCVVTRDISTLWRVNKMTCTLYLELVQYAQHLIHTAIVLSIRIFDVTSTPLLYT